MLWQGKPSWKGLALRVLHVRKVAFYLLVILAVRMVLSEGTAGYVGFVTTSAIGIGILLLLAYFFARSTVYTITTKRVVMRFGVALPITLNLPFKAVDAADLKMHRDGSGEIVLVPRANRRLSYAVLWPHAKPWRLGRPQPMLRCIPDAQAVAAVLSDALSRSAATDKIVEPTEADRKRAREQRLRPQAEERRGRFQLNPLAAAWGLVAFALVSVGWVSYTGNGPARVEIIDVVDHVSLRFTDQEDGSVAVTDAATDEPVGVLNFGQDHFVRATMRGLVKSRRAAAAGDESPFDLYRTAAGNLWLVDPVTTQQIDLRAYGAPNAEAFARFLPGEASRDPVSVSHADTKVERPNQVAALAEAAASEIEL